MEVELARLRALLSHVLANKGCMTVRVIRHSEVVPPRRGTLLVHQKKGLVRSLLAALAGALRTRDGHSAGRSDPSMPAEAKALVPAEFPVRATPRPVGRRWTGSPPELWFPYAPITESFTIMFAPVSTPLAPPCPLHGPRKQSP